MKKILNLIVFFLVIGIVPVSAKEKVKVYIFEAGGCPYCEAEIEYLEGLDSYGEKFEIVRKELYVVSLLSLEMISKKEGSLYFSFIMRRSLSPLKRIIWFRYSL